MSRAVELAHWLNSEGVGRRHRVAVEIANCEDLIPALIAVWALPAVVVPIDPLWGDWLRDHILSHSGANVVLSPAGAPSLTSTPSHTADHHPELPHDCAMISYTSGTAANPRGVVLRHSHLLSAYRGGATALRATTGVRPHTVGCAMRVSGLGILGVHHLWAATMGACTVSFSELSLENVGAYWENMVDYHVQLTYLVPALVSLVNFASPNRPSDAPLPTVLSGGAPLPAISQRRFQSAFGTRLLNIYGLTEVAFAAFFGDLDQGGWGTPSVGRPVTVSARLRGQDGALLKGPGEGELELAGDVLTDGYYAYDAATESSIVDRWLRTGDIARVDDAGRYRIVGRCKDVVLKGAFTIHLSEVEAAAQGLPGVIDAGALRLEFPDELEDLGLVIQVGVDAEPDTTNVRLLLEQRLGRQRCPRRVAVVSTPLPKVGHGKLDRRGLASLWREITGGRSDAALGSDQPKRTYGSRDRSGGGARNAQ